MADFYDRFFLLYQQGLKKEAYRELFPSPEAPFDDTDERLWPVGNDFFASIFGTLADALLAKKYLISQLQDPDLIRLWTQEQVQILKQSDDPAWQCFCSMRPDVAKFRNQRVQESAARPWFEHSFDLQARAPTFSGTKVPLIFLEPLTGDFLKFFAPLKGEEAIFVFETLAHMQQLLQFPEALSQLCDPKHAIYLLDQYPGEQNVPFDRPVEPFFITSRPLLEKGSSLLMKAFSDPDWLYAAAKKLLFNIQSARFGSRRAAALSHFWGLSSWYDPHKTLPAAEKDLGEDGVDLFRIQLEKLQPPRSPTKPGRKKLVHVVNNLIDGGHAPSRIIEWLIRYSDKDLFETSLLCSDRSHVYAGDYPFYWVTSPKSKERAPKRFALFQELATPVYSLPEYPTLEATASGIASFLKEQEADIAIFHGADVVHYMASAQCSVPLRVIFEHGTVPCYPVFDLGIVSSSSALDVYQELFNSLGFPIRALPFAMEPSQAPLLPLTKEALGFPKTSRILTTISNHLETRVGAEMRRAIIAILERIPEAIYAPIGVVHDPDIFIENFGAVKDRIFPQGSLQHPSERAAAFDLYLNEFPFGSCYGILDAMSAGCPIISLYDLKGPPQARYGGDFFGRERMASSPEAYADLACQLLSNPCLYAEWSSHAKAMFAKRTDIEGYVHNYCKILSEMLR